LTAARPLRLLLLVALLAAGIYLGGHPQWLPAPVRDLLVGERDADVLDEALDVIEGSFYEPASRSKLLEDSLTAVVKGLGDRFSAYLSPADFARFNDHSSGRFSGVGLIVSEHPRGLEVRRVFERSPAAAAGIAPGELIVAVDGRSLAGKPSRVATALITGQAGTAVALTVVAGRRRRVERLRRARVRVPAVRSRLLRSGRTKIVDVELSTFSEGAHGELRAALDRALDRGARAVVLDLRGNGGGSLEEAVLAASLFIARGRIVSTRGRARERRNYDAVGRSIPRRLPVVVLVDGGTASAAEIVAGALQDRRRATIVGERTFGKGVYQEIVPLSGGGALDLTVGQYFLPSGRNVGDGPASERGLAPDVSAQDRPRTRRDEALDVALREVVRAAR